MTEVVFTEDAEHDLFSIYLHLFEARRRFGEAASESSLAAEARVEQIRRDVSATLARIPRIGTRRDDVLTGLRFVPVGGAVAYFREAGPQVQVLGVFQGGQDHRRRMDERLLG